MNFIDRHIIETYSGLLDGLSSTSKIELIESLSKSVEIDEKNKDVLFYKSFGAFGSGKPAEELITDIKSSRKFKNRELKF